MYLIGVGAKLCWDVDLEAKVEKPLFKHFVFKLGVQKRQSSDGICVCNRPTGHRDGESAIKEVWRDVWQRHSTFHRKHTFEARSSFQQKHTFTQTSKHAKTPKLRGKLNDYNKWQKRCNICVYRSINRKKKKSRWNKGTVWNIEKLDCKMDCCAL